MRSPLYIFLTIAGILFALLIIAFGARLIPMAERGPGYIASNLAYTIDSVAAAPEKTYVEYELPRDYWQEKPTPSHNEYVAKLIIFEKDTNKFVVSKYTFCEYAGLLVRSKIEFVLEKTHEYASSIPVIGGTLDAVGDAFASAGNTLGLTKEDNDEKLIKEQVKKYSYYRMEDDLEYAFWGRGDCGYDFDYEFSATDLSPTALLFKGLCESETFIAQEFNEADFIGKVYYNYPEKFMFSKDEPNDKLKVEAECGN